MPKLSNNRMAWVLTLAISACSSRSDYMTSVENVDLQKFMGKWYVLGGRFTFLEKDVHNAVEVYAWNSEKNRIDIDFKYNKGSLNGPIKSTPQTGWVVDPKTQGHWKVSPFWPLKFDYLIVALAEDYSWTAIGVPSQKYLWIMARDWKSPDAVIAEAVAALAKTGYDAQNLIRVPHSWPSAAGELSR